MNQGHSIGTVHSSGSGNVNEVMGSSDKLQFSGCWLLTALLPRGGEIHSCADFPSPLAPESGFAELRRGIPATVSLELAAAQSS